MHQRMFTFSYIQTIPKILQSIINLLDKNKMLGKQTHFKNPLAQQKMF